MAFRKRVFVSSGLGLVQVSSSLANIKCKGVISSLLYFIYLLW